MDGTKSGQAFVCTRISYDYKTVICLGSRRYTEELDPDELEKVQIEFIKEMMYKYKTGIDYILPDSAESVLIRGLKRAVEVANINTTVRGCEKGNINDRIDCERIMIAYNMFWYIKDECDTLVDALSSALWDEDSKEDERLDDLTTDIDTLDAFEYSFSRYIKRINDAIDRDRQSA